MEMLGGQQISMRPLFAEKIASIPQSALHFPPERTRPANFHGPPLDGRTFVEVEGRSGVVWMCE